MPGGLVTSSGPHAWTFRTFRAGGLCGDLVRVPASTWDWNFHKGKFQARENRNRADTVLFLLPQPV